jgi:hypothetical protein
MANHLMGGHVSPTGFTLRAHPLQSVDHLFSVRYIEECFFSEKAFCTFKTVNDEGVFYHGRGLSPGGVA